MTWSRPPLVVATREEQPDDGFVRVLRAGGVQALAMPTITIAPPQDTAPLTASIERLSSTDWIVFTSAQAVAATCGHPRFVEAWSGLTVHPRIATVGPGTAARLRSFGLTCAVVPRRSGGRELAEALAAVHGTLAGLHVLWPRSDIARRELPDALAAAGARVSDPEAYRTVAVKPAALATFTAALCEGRIGAVAFFSPSAAAGLAAAWDDGTLRPLAGRTEVASIGPSTSGALGALGAPPTVEAETRTGAGLAGAILQQLRQCKGAA